MKIRHKETGRLGDASCFNTHGLGEMIVCFDDDQTSDYIRDYEFFIEELQVWMDPKQAFADHHVIIDNLNTKFFEPDSVEDKARGYTLY